MEIDSNRLPEGPLPRRLADRYMSIVRRHAYRLARRLPSHVHVEDLMGAGFVGLADALNKYDRSGPDRFEAYADCRIRGAMLDELRSYDPLSRDLRDLNNRIVSAVRCLTAELGRPPEEIEIAQKLELPVAAFRERLLSDDATEAADHQLLRTERRERLSDAVGQLPERLQSLLRLYYEQDYTLREIGDMLGVTESRACQLHAEAIVRLRAAVMESEAEKDDLVTSVRRLRTIEEAPARKPNRRKIG